MIKETLRDYFYFLTESHGHGRGKRGEGATEFNFEELSSLVINVVLMFYNKFEAINVARRGRKEISSCSTCAFLFQVPAYSDDENIKQQEVVANSFVYRPTCASLGTPLLSAGKAWPPLSEESKNKIRKKPCDWICFLFLLLRE